VVPTRESIPQPPLPLSPASVHPLETNGTPDPRDSSDIPPDLENACSCFASIEPTLSEVFRHSGWAQHRRNVWQALWRTGQSLSRLTSFLNCGETVHVLQSLLDPPEYRLGGSYCHDRVCLPCANDRARTIARNLIAALPGKRTRFLTLTIADSTPKLAPKLDRLQSSLVALRKTRLWKERVTGGAAFLEVKRSERSPNWHVHYHILLTGRYIPHAELKHTWHNITGDSFVVDIRPAGGLTAVSRYVTKYASKPITADVLRDPDLLDEAIVALRGRRLCQTFGGLRGVKLTDTGESGEWIELGTLDDFLRRERDGDVEVARILATIRTHGLDDARHCLRNRPNPPPVERPVPPLKFPLLDRMLPGWQTDALCSLVF